MTAGKVTVVGSGSWGTVVTRLIAPHAREVVVWSFEPEVAAGINANHKNPHQMRDFTLAQNVRATTSFEEALEGAEAVAIVVPSAFIRTTLRQLAPHLGRDVPVVVLTKGVERETGCLMADVAEQELANMDRIAVLSGPNHAEEISQGKVSAAVIAARDQAVAAYFQELLSCEEFRVYVSEDVVGVEVCAAVKNVIALACGIAVASGAGDNTLAVLMTRGLAEVSRIAVALGADPLTCMGLAGMGDLVVTCISHHSRNRSFGEAFARGESLASYEHRTGMVVEGAEAAASVLTMAERHGIAVPITKAVYELLYEGASYADVRGELLERLPNEEFYGVVPGAQPGSNTRD